MMSYYFITNYNIHLVLPKCKHFDVILCYLPFTNIIICVCISTNQTIIRFRITIVNSILRKNRSFDCFYFYFY